MKKLLTLTLLGMMLGGLSGCRIAECWRYAWNSRFPPKTQQAVVVAEPCVVCEDPCESSCPCPSPCSAPASVPSPIPVK
jgi:hypothetical protein